MTDSNHEPFIRHCYTLAREAAANGNHPFGALLVHEGNVVLTAVNTVISQHDVTCHAELNLVREAGPRLGYATLAQSVLYTSTEPCAMCAGAIFWAGIPTIIYGCAAESLGRVAGGTFVVPSRQLLAHATRPTNIIGPVLEAEGIAIHEAFWPHFSNPLL